MKIKLFIVVLVGSVLLAVSTLSFRTKHYTPRQESRIDKAMSYLRPGGKTAAGMAEYFGALRNNVLTGTVSIEEYNAAIDASLNMQSKRAVNSIWNELGPDNVGGRTRAFLQDKDTPANMLVASVSGGLFRSTTRGGSWTPVNDFQENLNITCITQNSEGIIIYGTGEGAFVSVTGRPDVTPAFLGAGVFRSTDRGRSFTRVLSTAGYGTINSAASEKNGGRMYIATPGGIRWSDDGSTWAIARNGSSKEVKVDVNGVVYAESGVNVVKSTDRGQSWSIVTPTGATITTRAAIAISPEDPNYVYVMSCNNSRMDGVFRSKDAGQNWERIIEKGTPFFDPLVSGLSNPQGYYDMVISVDPKDKNHLLMGGAALAEWKEGNVPRYIGSLNDLGGANPVYVHADKHILEWDMTTNPPTFICGNDGGLFFSSDNLKTFKMKNYGFNVTQFYAVAADYEGNVVGGSQDNGTQYVNKNGNTKLAAVEVNGGDGFQAEISVKNNAIMISETYYGNMSRSRDYGKSQSCIWDRRISKVFGPRLTDTSKYCEFNHDNTWAPFNAKFRLWEHPAFDNTASRLFFSRNGQLWMALNVTNFVREPEWYLLTSAHGGGQVWDIEPTRDGNSVFLSNSNTIYRIDGLNSATYYKWSLPTAIPPGITVTNMNFTLGGSNAITSICLDPNDNNVALVTIGNYGVATHVVKGTNMLGTPVFTNITKNLPQMPVYDGLISLTNSNLMFLATELGVYASDDGGNSWSAQTNSTNNFPKVATLAIRQYSFPNRSKGSIYAGTHGRGFYECQQYMTSINPVFAGNGGPNNNMSVYPNPANTETNIKFDNTDAQQDLVLKIIDLTGKTVLVKMVGMLPKGEQIIKVDVLSLPTGTYVATVTKGNKPVGTIKLVIRH